MAREFGADLIGHRAVSRLGLRFPLLVKLIDAADWLSLQVHPDDDVACRLAGPGNVGKTEAWVVLGAEPAARLVTGPAPTVPPEAFRAAVADGTISRTHVEEHPARAGDAWLVPAGTIHAIGAGTFMYEIEQPSDLTYRISDWGRPLDPARPLQAGAALAALDPRARATRAGTTWRLDGGALVCPYFRLELLLVERATQRSPRDTVEILTVIEGAIALELRDGPRLLRAFETVVIPAAMPGYEIVGAPAARICIGSIP